MYFFHTSSVTLPLVATQYLSHPLISGEPEGLGEEVILVKQLRVSFDQGSQSLLGHVGNEIVEQASLAEQGRVAASGIPSF
jgi:hypothetical protein